MAQARHWLERLAQLSQFENVVLRQRNADERDHPNEAAGTSQRVGERH